MSDEFDEPESNGWGLAELPERPQAESLQEVTAMMYATPPARELASKMLIDLRPALNARYPNEWIAVGPGGVVAHAPALDVLDNVIAQKQLDPHELVYTHTRPVGIGI